MNRIVLFPTLAVAAAVSACATVPAPVTSATAPNLVVAAAPAQLAPRKLPAVPPLPENYVDPVDLVRLSQLVLRERPVRQLSVAELPRTEMPDLPRRVVDVRPRPRVLLASAEPAPLEGLAQGGPEVPLPVEIRRFETLR